MALRRRQIILIIQINDFVLSRQSPWQRSVSRRSS
jgi:hypothetical protein